MAIKEQAVSATKKTPVVEETAKQKAERFLAMRADVDRKLAEYRRVLAETEASRERAVKTLRKAGYLRDD